MDIQERQPLLNTATPTNLLSTPSSQHGDRSLSSDESPTPFLGTLPGANYRKSLNWSSAYILVMSRVIGSGIFATPGSIVKSTGSIGLTLLVWLAGTILSGCGLAVSMEFGCMLPRSGGEKVKQQQITAKSQKKETTWLNHCFLFAVSYRCTSSIPILDRGSSRQAW